MLTGYVVTRWSRAPDILLGSVGCTCLMDLWPSGEFTVCWTRAAKCWWAAHHSCSGYSSLPAPFFLAQRNILFASLSAILQILPCLVHSCKGMTFFARSTARFSTLGSQAFMLQHSSIECSQRSLLSAPCRLPSPHNRACHFDTFHAMFTSGTLGVVSAVLKKTELSVARNATQTKALPNLYCRGRLKGANASG